VRIGECWCDECSLEINSFSDFMSNVIKISADLDNLSPLYDNLLVGLNIKGASLVETSELSDVGELDNFLSLGNSCLLS